MFRNSLVPFYQRKWLESSGYEVMLNLMYCLPLLCVALESEELKLLIASMLDLWCYLDSALSHN